MISWCEVGFARCMILINTQRFVRRRQSDLLSQAYRRSISIHIPYKMKTSILIEYTIKVVRNAQEITWARLSQVSSYVNDFVEAQLAFSHLLGVSYLEASVVDVVTDLHEISNVTVDANIDFNASFSTTITIGHSNQIPSNLVECIVIREMQELSTSELEYFEQFLGIELTFSKTRLQLKLASADIGWLLWGSDTLMKPEDAVLFNSTMIRFLNKEGEKLSNTTLSTDGIHALHVLLTTQEVHAGFNTTKETSYGGYPENRRIKEKNNESTQNKTGDYAVLEVHGIVFGYPNESSSSYQEMVLEMFDSAPVEVLLECFPDALLPNSFSKIHKIATFPSNVSNIFSNGNDKNVNLVQHPSTENDTLNLIEPKLIVVVMITLHLLIMTIGGVHIIWRRQKNRKLNEIDTDSVVV